MSNKIRMAGTTARSIESTPVLLDRMRTSLLFKTQRANRPPVFSVAGHIVRPEIAEIAIASGDVIACDPDLFNDASNGQTFMLSLGNYSPSTRREEER